ncbi:MAG: hypothetical protein NC177_03915 [Ruminococcus flavefaciens]|nr:hypothetical protein [Ruminococcus flavefaciens]
MHYGDGGLTVCLVILLTMFLPFLLSFIFLFKTVKPISNYHIIKNFQKYSGNYEKTTAVVKSTGNFLTVICYNIGEREISVIVPYYIPHETVSIIYRKCNYNKVIVDCPELWQKAIVKNLVASAIFFVLWVGLSCLSP